MLNQEKENRQIAIGLALSIFAVKHHIYIGAASA